MAYVEAMYELSGGRMYSDLYLYNLGYGATLPEEPGFNRGFLWTDQQGNLMSLSKCHSGIFIIYTTDKRWKYVFSSSRIEEAVYKYLCQLKKGTHWNKQLQHYFDVEKGDLEIDILEICPRRLLRVVKKKWCEYYNQSMGRRNNPINKTFKEEDWL